MFHIPLSHCVVVVISFACLQVCIGFTAYPSYQGMFLIAVSLAFKHRHQLFHRSIEIIVKLKQVVKRDVVNFRERQRITTNMAFLEYNRVIE